MHKSNIFYSAMHIIRFLSQRSKLLFSMCKYIESKKEIPEMSRARKLCRVHWGACVGMHCKNESSAHPIGLYNIIYIFATTEIVCVCGWCRLIGYKGLPFVLVMPDWFLLFLIGRLVVVKDVIVLESVTKPSDETIT